MRTAAQPTLEGWAIVDNTTGEDWTNVRLSLVSGKPISFISQLYPPKYIARLGAELAEDQAVAPTVYSGAVQDKALAPPPPQTAAGALPERGRRCQRGSVTDQRSAVQFADNRGRWS